MLFPFKERFRMGIRPDHKVLVVLDHGPRFAKSSDNLLSITLKESSVNRVVGKCDKSLWTWCIEATLELHRTVSDLFPQEQDRSCSRLLRLVLVDYVGRVLQPHWGTELVTQQELLNALSATGLPSTNDDNEGAAISGLTLAIEALSQLSDAQLERNRRETVSKHETSVGERDNFRRVPKCWQSPCTSSVSESGKKPQENCGSVVIFTSYTDKESLTELENEVVEMVDNRNRIIKSLQDSAFSCINNVRLYIINILPNGLSCNIASKSFREVSTTVSSYIFSRTAGADLISAIHSIAIDIYDLVSTTVSGIPMKEEAQQGQSAVAINYDVELLHRREAHSELERLGLVTPNSVEDSFGSLMVFSGGATYPTARLVWATPVPKGRWSMFPRNRHASRVTPSQVNSRPSVCLSSYLLQGRNVMLEVMRVAKSEGLLNNVGTKLIAHTLIAHGGHIYIHANDIGPHSVLDSQDIREKTKLKRAANLRISDFISLIRECTLRIPNESEKQTSMTPSNILCAQPRQHLLRLTRYWPLRSDQCFIYNVPKRFDTFFTIIRQPQLSTVDADKCRQIIHQLTTLRDSKERLTETWVDTILLKDGNDREEQLQVAFEEIARHLGNYINHSDRHNEIFQLFTQLTGLERLAKVLTSDVVLADRTRGQDAATVNSTLQTAFVLPSTPCETRNLSRSNSPPPKKSRKACYLWKPNETLNLYDYLMEKEERHHRTHWVDFVGRVKAGNRPGHLYSNLEATTTTAKQD